MTAFWKRRRREPFDSVRWLSAQDSPFGVEVLDCRPVAQNATATTESREVAERFVQQRDSDGSGLIARSPEDCIRSACALEYPHEGETRDGPVFKAEEMEDKWDIYLYEGHLYFTRSWTGDLFLRARMVFEPDRARMLEVETARQSYTDDAAAVRVIDFLIRSHLYGWIVPHPLPEGMGRDPGRLAMASFVAFGRRGWFGTFAETTAIQPLVARD